VDILGYTSSDPQASAQTTVKRESKGVLVLGGGVTGLTVAVKLLERGHRVLLLEKAPAVGGLASTFQFGTYTFDTGSHRLHADYAPHVAELIKGLCGDDLLRRDRGGRIYINHRPLRYPPTVVDIAASLTVKELVTALADFIRARIATRGYSETSFEQYTVAKVGQFLYRRFYYPYALKLYGKCPTTLSIEPALTRVRCFQLRVFVRDMLRHLVRQRPHYYYPRHGIGQIATALKDRFLAAGGELMHVNTIDLAGAAEHCIAGVAFRTKDGSVHTRDVDTVISTIPIDALLQLAYPQDTIDLSWRDLRILYLVCRGQHLAPHETYYSPDEDIVFGRVSDLNKYSPSLNASSDHFVLAAEIPCSPQDAIATMSDADISARCLADLKKLRIVPPATTVDRYYSRTLKQVYPIYDHGWQQRFDKVYYRLDAVDNLYMIGRSALFMHCNIDHCMLMAIELADHLSGSEPRKALWQQKAKNFLRYRIRE
jgi:protoporphyrinogen oxidase